MLNKKIIALTIFLISLFVVSAVSANENITGEISVDYDNQLNIDENGFILENASVGDFF